ncbi:MAG: phage tail family protein [Candidatus Hydrogenedentes bacterium]|nr:phage tail family protein [Candidatus Hydrogenedentota bacterium]
MSISVGGYVFNPRTTVVREQYEVVGGKQTRAIRITGLLRGAADEASLIAALDAVTEAVSMDAPVLVSLRPGRQIAARREGLVREINGRALTGQFVVDLRAESAWEESEAIETLPWVIGQSGEVLGVSNTGNAPTDPVITLAADDFLITPGVGDGTRMIVYEGEVAGGSTLVIDAVKREVRLDGVEVTGYTSGEFPRLAPGETELVFTDDIMSSHQATGSVAWRPRWW